MYNKSCFSFKAGKLESHSEQPAQKQSVQTNFVPNQNNTQKANKIERVNVVSQSDKVLSFHLRQSKLNTRV